MTRPNPTTDPVPLLLAVNSLSRGGAERMVVELARRLPAHGFAPSVATVMGGGAFSGDLDAIGISVYDLQRRPGSLGLGTIARTAALVRRHRFPLVHTHLWSADTWVRPGARLAGARIVVTEHNVNRDQKVAHRILKRGLAPLTHRFIAVSAATGEYMEDWEGIDPSLIEVIQNGIDLAPHAAAAAARCEPAPWRADPAQGPILGIIGRLAPQKAVHVALDALPAIRRVFPGARIEIAGSGPLEASLRERTRSLGIAHQVAFLGDLPEPAEALARWHLLLHPAAWEGFGLVVAEAMASGLPVVASGVGGIPEVMADRLTGRLVPPGEIAPLVDAVVECLEDPARTLKLGRRGRARAERLFDVDRMVARTAALYRRVLGMDPRPDGDLTDEGREDPR